MANKDIIQYNVKTLSILYVLNSTTQSSNSVTVKAVRIGSCTTCITVIKSSPYSSVAGNFCSDSGLLCYLMHSIKGKYCTIIDIENISTYSPQDICVTIGDLTL